MCLHCSRHHKTTVNSLHITSHSSEERKIIGTDYIGYFFNVAYLSISFQSQMLSFAFSYVDFAELGNVSFFKCSNAWEYKQIVCYKIT